MNEERQQEIERANKRIAELQHKWETNKEFRYHWDRVTKRSTGHIQSPREIYPTAESALGNDKEGWYQNKGLKKDEMKLDSREFFQETMIKGPRNETHNQKLQAILKEFKSKNKIS